MTYSIEKKKNKYTYIYTYIYSKETIPQSKQGTIIAPVTSFGIARSWFVGTHERYKRIDGQRGRCSVRARTAPRSGVEKRQLRMFAMFLYHGTKRGFKPGDIAAPAFVACRSQPLSFPSSFAFFSPLPLFSPVS